MGMASSTVPAEVSETATRAVRVAAAQKLSKTSPLKGLDRVAEDPTSKRAVASAVMRTGVTAGLASLIGTPAASATEEVLHNIGYRRAIVITLAVSFLSLAAVVMAVFMVFTMVASVASAPLRVIEALFGGDDSSQEDATPLAELCVIPSPTTIPAAPLTTAAPVPPEESSVDGEPAPPPVSESPSALPAAIGSDGKVTTETREVVSKVPRGADPLRAESFILYSLSHPHDAPTWDDFEHQFTPTRDAVKARGVTGTDVPVTASAVVKEIDPDANIAPYTLVSASAVAKLMNDGYVKVAEDRQGAALERVQALCASPDDNGASTTTPTAARPDK